MGKLLAVILLLSSGSVWGASWREINGGLPTTVAGAGGLAIDPANPTTLYSWTLHPGNRSLLRSTDGGANWKPVSGITGVSWLVADPNSSATLYAGTNYGPVKSVDGGASWTRLSSEAGTRWLSSLAVDRQDSDTLYAVSDVGRVIRSTDGGASWQPSSTGLPGPPYPGFLAIDPVTPSTLYVTVENGGIFRSIDRGQSWVPIKAGAANFGGARLVLAIDPVTPSTIYAGSFAAATGPRPEGGRPDGGEGSISKSTDGGRSWKVVRAGIPPYARVNSFVIDPATPSNVYASFDGGVLKSVDGGETWSVLNAGLPAGNIASSAVVMDARIPSTLYWGYVDRSEPGGGGVLKSTDGGASWSPVNTGRTIVDAGALALHPVNASILYAAAGRNGLFQSVDRGENWARLAAFQFPAAPSSPTAAPFPGGPVSARSVVISLARPNILYALTGRVNGCDPTDQPLLKSTDGGASWNDATPPLSGCSLWNFGNSVAMVLDPTDANTLYVGADFGDINGENPALLKTTDGGTSWSNPLNWGCCAASALAVDPSDPAILYGGSWSGVLKSSDGGATWSNTGLTVGVNVVALDPRNRGTLYAASDTGYGSFGGLFKSTDGGVSWSAINDGLESLLDTRVPVTALAVDPANRNVLYAGTAGFGVFRSGDGGESWAPFNDGLTNLDIRLLALAPGRAGTLYAGTGSGVAAVSRPSATIRSVRGRR